MKNALILHGTSANPESNWFPWLKQKLEAAGYTVWVPELPDADYPDMQKYREFIFGSDFTFGPETVMIGHSSGAVAALSLLEVLPSELQISTAVMVGVYRPEKQNYSSPEPISIDKLKGKSKRMVFIHSDNDPFCPLEDAQYFAYELDAALHILPGEDHFSYQLNKKHTTLPKLTEILDLEVDDR